MTEPFFRPTGSWVAMPTPYKADGSIDFGGFKTLIDRQIQYGTSELFLMGSTGENTMLILDERHEIIRRIVKMTKGRIPVFFGSTLPTTEASVEFAKFAEAEGADGLIFTVPAYLLPPQTAVLEYFRACMGPVKIPVAARRGARDHAGRDLAHESRGQQTAPSSLSPSTRSRRRRSACRSTSRSTR